MVILVGKICVLAFFGVIFGSNFYDLVQAKIKGIEFTDEVIFDKQMWMLISLLAIALVLNHF